MLIRITRSSSGYYEIVEPYEPSGPDLLVAISPVFPEALQYVFQHYNDIPGIIRVIDYTEKSMEIEIIQ